MTAAPDAAVASTLAEFAIESGSEAIPSAVREHGVLHLLDALGCGLAAVGTGTADHASALAADQGGAAEASLLGRPDRVPATLAAFANGTSCHGLDYDDTHEAGICHSSAVMGPTALAVAESNGSSGRETLDAFVLGTEVALRIAVCLADGLYERGFHPTSVCGAFGATATAARLLGLDVERTTNALGIVGSFAGGLLAYLSDGSATKPLHAGWAAQAGIFAARLAAASATGPARIVEGPMGLMESHIGDTRGADSICEGLGDRWELADISLKAFPVCHFAHSSIWAAAELVQEHGLAVADIAEITVRVPAEGAALVLEPLDAKRRPKTPYDGKFSLPFTVAHRLVHNRLDLAAFSQAAIEDPAVLELADRVSGELIPPPAPSRFAGGVRIVTSAGDVLDRLVPHAPGSVRNPLDEQWVLEKFRSNAELAIQPAAAATLLAELRSLDAAPSLDAALEIARGARSQPS